MIVETLDREAGERSGAYWLVLESYRAARYAEAVAQGDVQSALCALNQLPRVEVHSNARKVRVRLKDDGTAGMQARWRIAQGRGKRGECKGFSDASRRNLFDKMNTIRRDAEKPLFLTLTIARELDAVDAKRAKSRLRAFVKRLSRSFGDVCVMWRMEPHQDGALHFHLFVWGAGFLPWQWVSVQWAEVCAGGDFGEPPILPGASGAKVFRDWVENCDVSEVAKKMANAGTRVEIIKTWNGAMSYAAKYLGKGDDLPAGEDGTSIKWGRVWGIMGEREGVFDEAEVVIVSPSDAFRVVTAIRRSIRARVGWREFVEKTMKCYTDTPENVWKIIERGKQ